MILEYVKGFELLKKYNIKVAQTKVVNSLDEAYEFAKGRKIVLKLYSEKATHKAKLGLVKIDLSKEEIKETFKEFKKIAKKFNLQPYEIIAQEMLPIGKEAIIGANEDEQFGKFIIFGLGGSYVEIFKDISSRLCPINKKEALEMIEEIKAKELLFKNERMKEKIANLIAKVSKIVEKENIKELDINPIMIYENSYKVADVRIMVEG
ncbi:MAG: acetate--CoA ligase family protein [Candidatus Micrarchaeia archaeon]